MKDCIVAVTRNDLLRGALRVGCCEKKSESDIEKPPIQFTAIMPVPSLYLKFGIRVTIEAQRFGS